MQHHFEEIIITERIIIFFSWCIMTFYCYYYYFFTQLYTKNIVRLNEKRNLVKHLPDSFNGSSAILLGSRGVPNGKGLGPKWNGWKPWFPVNELNNRPNTRFNLIIFINRKCINLLTGFRPGLPRTVHRDFDGFRISGHLWWTRIQHYCQRKTFSYRTKKKKKLYKYYMLRNTIIYNINGEKIWITEYYNLLGVCT